MNKERIKEFVKDRDTAIMELDLKKFKRFIKKWHFPGSILSDSDEVLKITMRKMCLECTQIPTKNKIQACEWLIAHGYLTDMFGNPIIARYEELKEEWRKKDDKKEKM